VLFEGGIPRFAFGSANLVYPASATETATATVVGHGLESVPRAVVAMTASFSFAEGGPDIIGTNPAPTSTELRFWGRRVTAVPAGGLTVPFFWLAVK
jgi:hypothetical protein